MLFDEALELTLRDVLRFSLPGRTGRAPVEVDAIVEGLLALEKTLTERQARFERKSKEWLAGVIENAFDAAISKHGNPGAGRGKPRKPRRCHDS